MRAAIAALLLASSMLLLGCGAVAQCKPPAPATQSKFFGMHFPSGVPASPGFPVSTVRGWDSTGSYWLNIQPSSGTYSWTALDANLATVAAGTDVIYTFGGTPAWAATTPAQACDFMAAGSCSPPANDADWSAFVSAVVQRTCGKVKYFELWNEPNGPVYWTGTAAQMVHLASVAYPLIHSTANCACSGASCSPGLGGGTNPNKMLAPPVSNIKEYGTGRDWIGQLLTAGIGTYVDVWSFHGYGYETPRATGGTPDQFIYDWGWLKSTLADAGQGSKEIWNTEYSFGSNGAYAEESLTEAAKQSYLVKMNVILAYMRVPRALWYAYDNCHWGTLYGFNCNSVNSTTYVSDGFSGIRPTGTSYIFTANLLNGASAPACSATHVLGNDSYTWSCLVVKGAWRGVVVWNVAGATYTVPAWAHQKRDVNGTASAVTGGSSVSISSSPLLFESGSRW